MKRVGLIVAWMAVAALLSTAAYQIVAAAESQVSDQALTPIVAITADSSATSLPGIDPTTTRPDQASSSVPSTTVESTTSTSTGASTTSSPTTTAPASSSTSTTSGSAWTSRTVPTAGGDVVIEHRTGEVRLVVARPAAGFRVEVEAAGPPSVEVEFENESSEKRFKIRARWQDGGLSITVEED